MHALHIHPDDARWFLRWMRGNLIGLVLILAVLSALQWCSPAKRDELVATRVRAEASSAGDKTDAMLPEGWRRTSTGWEHTSTWTVSKSIEQWIEIQQDREPRWMATCLAILRQTPPLVYAAIQLALIATIVRLRGQANKVS